MCGGTTARSAYYEVTSDTLAMVPENILLCKSHFKGYTFFIKQNKLDGYACNDVFNAYLVRKTFVNSVRQPYVVMMRKAFHAKEKDYEACKEG